MVWDFVQENIATLHRWPLLRGRDAFVIVSAQVFCFIREVAPAYMVKQYFVAST